MITYITIDRKNKRNVSTCEADIEYVQAIIQSMVNLSRQYGVEGDEGELTFFGSKDMVQDALPMYGYLHKGKTCGDLYNEKIIILNLDEIPVSLTKEQLDYFSKVYKEYSGRETGSFFSN